MSMNRTIWVLVFVVVLLVGACDLGAQPSPGPICTEIGCESLLTIGLSEASLDSGGTYQVAICVDAECVDETVTIDQPGEQGEPVYGEVLYESGRLTLRSDDNTISFTLPGADYGPTADVRVEIHGDDGQMVATGESPDLPLERLQPNGPEWPPVCFQGHIEI